MARPPNAIAASRLAWPAVATLAVAVALTACAEGSELTDASGSGSPPSGGGGSGMGGSGGEQPTGSSSRASSGSAGPTASAGSTTGASASGGGEGGAGDGGAGEGGAGEGGAGSTTSASSTSSGGGVDCDFSSPNACASAENLGAIAGDEAGAPVTVQGTTAKWFRIRVEERASGISESDLSYRVSLTSPPGMNYDLVVMEGPQDGDPTCGGTPKVGQANGSTEAVSASWDDDQGFGGEDDSLWLSIEVRHVSGDQCDLDDRWTLTIQGDV